MDRSQLVDRWFALTRGTMPGVAAGKGWPVRLDHCFQRILLDNAVGGPWREHVAAPAYRNASDAVLREAIRLGEAAIAGELDLADLNRRSLVWRGKA
ncbi:GCN5-related N-acetyltransferase [Qipengyuania sp. JC766]|uniref:GCN5-related N-acetyltransferase n=1 Tax=Qipengyuania sp. JC766 TaxID=3232139 RepID=UPI00345A7F9A